MQRVARVCLILVFHMVGFLMLSYYLIPVKYVIHAAAFPNATHILEKAAGVMHRGLLSLKCYPNRGPWTLSNVTDCLWSPYVIGQTIIFLPCDFYLLLLSSLFFFA